MKSDDLMVLLEIARCGSFLKAGSALGLDHSTVSRRLGALERELKAQLVHRGVQGCTLTPAGERLLTACEQVEAAVSEARRLSAENLGSAEQSGRLSGLVRVAATEAFGTYVLTDVLSQLHVDNPGLQVELITQTRLSPYGVGADIEIGVGDPVRGRPGARKLASYRLGLYATEEYLTRRGTPSGVSDVAEHSLVYYVEGLLRVEDLDVLGRLGVRGNSVFGATSPHAQLRATLAGAGIGLLPAFMAASHPELRTVLGAEVEIEAEFSAYLLPGRLRRPAAPQVMEKIFREVWRRRGLLSGRPDLD